MKNFLENIGNVYNIAANEVWLYLLLSGSGWAYFLYMYIFSSGLGAVLPKYAGY